MAFRAFGLRNVAPRVSLAARHPVSSASNQGAKIYTQTINTPFSCLKMVRRTMASTSPITPKTPVDPNAPGPMLRYQANLPKLPVPPLQATLQKYLRSVRPLLSDEDYKKTEQAVREFETSGAGVKLQERLEARAKDPSVVNWLEDWWLESAYMGYRDPVVIYVSYFFYYKDDKLRKEPAKRAAAITTAALEFKKQIVE